MTSILVSMVVAGVTTAVGEEICNAIGKMEYGKWIKVGGITLTASLGLGLVVKLIKQVKAFGA